MMSTDTCAKCGAELLVGARFCRRCGESAKLYGQGSVTEAETRLLQDTAERGAQTEYHEPRPTGPSYLAPNESTFAQTPAPTAPENARLERHGILWAIGILVAVFLIFGTVIALKVSRSSSSSTPITRIDVPPPPVIAPPVVPEVPQAPGTGKGSGSELIYPGAEVTMEMTRGTEGSVRQLRTKDSVDKVIAWYTEKLKPAKIIRASGSAVLSGNNATAVITDGDGETNVVLKEGIDR